MTASPEADDLRDAVARAGLIRAYELLAEKFGVWSPENGTRFPDKFSLEAVDGIRAAQSIMDEAATLRAEVERVTAERDAAREERDALKHASGFKPGPFADDLSRSVILRDISGMRPAMVEARRGERRAQNDADLWTMRMLDEWPGDTLLIRLWRQRRDATKRADTAETEATRLRVLLDGAVEGLTDMLAGWRYIREHHGDLYGVGWDRAEHKVVATLADLTPTPKDPA